MPDASIKLCTLAARLPARVLLACIWVYQRTLSPVFPLVLGPGCGCRFYPSCSHYAADAVKTHGALAGTWLAAKRLVKCQPWHSGGYDPVPAAQQPHQARPVCTRA